MIEERLLGFDVREAWMEPHELWDEERRARFLLRLDVAKPLSSDTMVWPSIFDTGQGIGLPQTERLRLGLAGLPVPAWIGRNSGLWESLADMRRYLASNWIVTRPCTTVAISWLSDSGFPEGLRLGPYLAATMPEERDPGWTLLGFDVSDGSLLSGLSNCGYSVGEVANLRRQWGALLNSAHLFDSPEPALRFRSLAGALVPEHAPFFVYGLYLVE